ncbi:hypothetical protein M1432_00670 [Patescibacteria group bacterium]|nr:hypothetical protein [Patescibacteria group bacterium]
MKTDILEQLKTLKKIAPDAEFAARSRRTILALAPERRSRMIFAAWPRMALGAAALATVFVFAFFFPGAPKTVPIASADALSSEFNNLSINIELKQISYNQNTNQTISSALTEISGTSTNHLNPAVLKAESEPFDPNAPVSNPEIDKLLNQALQ